MGSHFSLNGLHATLRESHSDELFSNSMNMYWKQFGGFRIKGEGRGWACPLFIYFVYFCTNKIFKISKHFLFPPNFRLFRLLIICQILDPPLITTVTTILYFLNDCKYTTGNHKEKVVMNVHNSDGRLIAYFACFHETKLFPCSFILQIFPSNLFSISMILIILFMFH